MFKEFDNLEVKIESINYFISLCNDYLFVARDYDGSGQIITVAETSTLLHILDNPGINVTALSKHLNRTKGAVSQIIRKLERKGLIKRELCLENRTITNFYTTERGQKLCIAHRLFEQDSYKSTFDDLSKTCTSEEINAFFKVMEAYIQVFQEGNVNTT